MIRVEKPNAPAGFESKAANATQLLWDTWNENAATIRSGESKLTFKSSIYASSEVKEALKLTQHGKCAFCESYFAHISYGDIEHFRPKGGWRQNANDRLSRPGYFWLAYDWSNLFYSCQLCNQRFKKNRFPLASKDKRSGPEQPDVGAETPLLIRPDEDGRQHISFLAQVPVGTSNRGKKMIQVLGLKRPELDERRIRHLRELAGWNYLVETLQNRQELTDEQEILRNAAKAHLKNATKPPAEYSACVMDAIQSNFKHVPWPSGDFAT